MNLIQQLSEQIVPNPETIPFILKDEEVTYHSLDSFKSIQIAYLSHTN